MFIVFAFDNGVDSLYRDYLKWSIKLWRDKIKKVYRYINEI